MSADRPDVAGGVSADLAITDAELAAWVDAWCRLDVLRPMTVERMRRSRAGSDPMWGALVRRGGAVIGGVRMTLFAWEGEHGSMRMDARAVDGADTAAVFDAAIEVTDRVRADAAPQSTFLAFVEANDERPMHHLLERGFLELERSRISTVHLTGDEPAPTAPSGIELTDLAARPDLAEATFRLERASFARIPTDMPLEPEMDLAWWRDRIDAATLGDDSLVLLALDPTLEATANPVVGVVELSPPSTVPGGGYVRFTGVAESHLRRGVARALKQAAAHLGAQRGWTFVSASNAEANVAMIALNDQLGYVRDGVRVVLERP